MARLRQSQARPGTDSEIRGEAPPKVHRKQQLIDAATRCMARQGYHATSMEDLATDGGVSVGLAYYYFKSKDDVLVAVIRDILERYMLQLPAAMASYRDPVERLAAGFRAYVNVIDGHRDAAILAYRESKTLPRRGRESIKRLEIETTQLLAKPIEDGAAQGTFVTVEPMLLAYDLVMFAHTWALKHWYFQERMTVNEYCDRQLAIVLSAVLRPAKKRKYARWLASISE